jgi:hypothetical protein
MHPFMPFSVWPLRAFQGCFQLLKYERHIHRISRVGVEVKRLNGDGRPFTPFFCVAWSVGNAAAMIFLRIFYIMLFIIYTQDALF